MTFDMMVYYTVRMKFLALLASAMCLIGCAGTQSSIRSSKAGRARLTLYWKGEDKWGSRTASGKKARQGKTLAAEKAFPFGTKILFPALRKLLGVGPCIVEDRGTAVQARKASKGQTPVFDLYCDNRREARRLALVLPEYSEYEIYN